MARERQTSQKGRSRGPATCRLASTENANVLAVDVDSSSANGRDGSGARDFQNFNQTLGVGMSSIRRGAPARLRDAAAGLPDGGARSGRAQTAVQASAASASE